MVSLEPPVSVLNCFGKCFKLSLYLFNVIFMLSGIAAIIVGIWCTLHPISFRVVVLTNSSLYIIASFILIGAGSVTIFVSIVGCCGARYENRCVLAMFAISLLLIFIAEFSAGVLSLAFYTSAKTFANEEMRDAVIEKYGQSNHHVTTEAYNYMQQMFDCCGFEGDGHDGAQLYQISLWFEFNLLQVPPSCCTRDDNGEPINLLWCQSRDNTHMSFINNIGCQEFVVKQGVKFSTIISGVGIGLSMLQLIGLVLAFCLFRRL